MFLLQDWVVLGMKVGMLSTHTPLSLFDAHTTLDSIPEPMRNSGVGGVLDNRHEEPSVHVTIVESPLRLLLVYELFA